MDAQKELSPRELADARLAESGLTRKEARALRLEPLTAAQVRKLDPSFRPYPALRIPYFSQSGRPTGFCRLRYLGEMNGFDRLRRRQFRYVQAPGTAAEVYLPPLRDWRRLAADASAALFVTEGELKAACATRAGLPTVGLGGVWSWRAARQQAPLLPALEAFAWQGRQVYLVFDSDYATNPDVMRALVALARELSSRGARPSLVTLPGVPALEEAGRKTGLDDFLVARGRAEFDRLVEEAAPFSQSEELWRLNGEVVYIRDPGLVVVLADGRKVPPGAFKEHAYSNRHYWETALNARGEQKMVKKPLAPAWLQWEQRGELRRLTYRPGAPAVTPEGEYNYWRGWGAEPRRGDVSLWRELLDYTFGADAAARAWFERWCAYPLQHPGAKLYAAAVVWGPTHGTGKSLIGYSLGACYGRNFKEISDEDLSGQFNEWAENRQLVMGDDVTGSEYRKATMELVKRMITRQTLTVNAKYMPTYEVPDCVNWYFTANHPDAFILEDTDRRYFVWEMPKQVMGDGFYDRYDAWLKDPAGLAPALLWHLTRLDLGDFNPRAHAMETAAKRAMLLDGKSDVGAWVYSLREDPDSALRVGGVPVAADLLANVQLLSLYDPEGRRKVTANGLGREMKRAGFEQVNCGAVVRTSKGPLRLYAVRNAARWARATPLQLARHWDGHFAAGGAPGAGKEKF
jgi:hypothetical protein